MPEGGADFSAGDSVQREAKPYFNITNFLRRRLSGMDARAR